EAVLTVFVADVAIPVVGLAGIRLDVVGDRGECGFPWPWEVANSAVLHNLAHDVERDERGQKGPSVFNQNIQPRHGNSTGLSSGKSVGLQGKYRCFSVFHCFEEGVTG